MLSLCNVKNNWGRMKLVMKQGGLCDMKFYLTLLPKQKSQLVRNTLLSSLGLLR